MREALARLLMWAPSSSEAACQQDYAYARAALEAVPATPAPVPVAERLPELRGILERIVLDSMWAGGLRVSHGELADRLTQAVATWVLPLPEVQP